ncbi:MULTISPECIES: DUF1501 domain-containing protein [unclassified Sphingomonas]|uniref:DUF1501 domain-containing protein n=1 Tax=unclassified Sphingomonas TaxID=196159 RepID=UPI000BC81236|nr:MAG: hypothetical protein B7Z43_07120 [Sphingomonas sp. 12-62-6]OYX39744.1 MAG: hypothetical protein B7Y98_03825 [Sphingomonas sp. 32-62-10]
MIDRRFFIAGGAASAAALGFAPRLVFAKAATNKRFVFIIQRGAADGLGTIAPVGDPAFVPARGVLAADFAGVPKLDSMFALHPNLKTVGALYAQKQALFAHAIASPYRDRSHFDGQNVLETGGAGAYQVKDGWLNRLLGLLPAEAAKAMAVSITVPMALRGANEVSSYAPSALPQASDDLMQRVAMLYQGDAQLHALWSDAMGTRALTGDMGADGPQNGVRNAAATGALAAKLLVPTDGARIAMIETGGWDTHAQQRGRLGQQLGGLDAMIAALKEGLGPLWADTMVLVATEFGRTVALNGTGGTDHGTASSAMLLGGAVKGGRVIADWPGLAASALYEGRDLRPTLPLDAFIGGAVAGHFGLDPARAMPALFPATRGTAIAGLV